MEKEWRKILKLLKELDDGQIGTNRERAMEKFEEYERASFRFLEHLFYLSEHKGRVVEDSELLFGFYFAINSLAMRDFRASGNRSFANMSAIATERITDLVQKMAGE